MISVGLHINILSLVAVGMSEEDVVSYYGDKTVFSKEDQVRICDAVRRALNNKK